MPLKDTEILDAITADPAKGKKSVVTGINAPGNWDAKDSPVQPASLDLRIGGILIPGKQANEVGSATNPATEYPLMCGHAAIVTTIEDLDMPTDMVAIGFPPSSDVSSRGLLMTNPGQVDPGYKGKMRFTVINMGRQTYTLQQGHRIVSLLFFKLSGNVSAGWAARHDNKPGSCPTQEDLDRLSHDFLDVEQRAERIAKSQRDKAIGLSALASAAAALVFTFAGVFLGNYLNPGWVEPLATLQTEVAALQAKRDADNLLPRITKLEQIEAGKTAVKPPKPLHKVPAPGAPPSKQHPGGK